MSRRSAHDRRQRRLLVGVGLMFFAPLGLAFFLYYGHGTWHPGARVNAGELIQPARPLPPLALPLLSSGSTRPDFLKRKWTLLYLATGPCAVDCRRHLYDMRQVRLALDRNMARVQRVFIAGGECCDAKFLHDEHPDLITVRLDSASAPLLALLPGGGNAVNAQRIYLIDPLGNLMMWYAADASPKGMLEDLQRLLRLSSIG